MLCVQCGKSCGERSGLCDECLAKRAASKPQVVIQPDTDSSPTQVYPSPNNTSDDTNNNDTNNTSVIDNDISILDSDPVEQEQITTQIPEPEDKRVGVKKLANKEKQYNPSHYDYAGFWYRSCAFLLDTSILSLIGFILSSFVFLIFKQSLAEITMIVEMNASLIAKNGLMAAQNAPSASLTTSLLSIILMTLYILMTHVYFTLFESSKSGATPGKLICGLHVVSLDFTSIDLNTATSRHMWRLVPFSPVILANILPLLTPQSTSIIVPQVLLIVVGTIIAPACAYLLVAASSNKQALHDMMSKTLVVYSNSTSPSNLLAHVITSTFVSLSLFILTIHGARTVRHKLIESINNPKLYQDASEQEEETEELVYEVRTYVPPTTTSTTTTTTTLPKIKEGSIGYGMANNKTVEFKDAVTIYNKTEHSLSIGFFDSKVSKSTISKLTNGMPMTRLLNVAPHFIIHLTFKPDGINFSNENIISYSVTFHRYLTQSFYFKGSRDMVVFNHQLNALNTLNTSNTISISETNSNETKAINISCSGNGTSPENSEYKFAWNIKAVSAIIVK